MRSEAQNKIRRERSRLWYINHKNDTAFKNRRRSATKKWRASHPLWWRVKGWKPKLKLKKKCATCGSEFETFRSFQKCCSMSCRVVKYQKENRAKLSLYRKIRYRLTHKAKPIKCVICSSSFYKKERKNAMTCSKKCSMKLASMRSMKSQYRGRAKKCLRVINREIKLLRREVLTESA